MILTSLHVPFLYDDLLKKWAPNPFPLNTRYPWGQKVIIADRRCNFMYGDRHAPIPHDAYMLYRLNDEDPFNFLSDKSGNWPGDEWPCMTPDFHPDPFLNFSQDLGAEARAFCWQLEKRMCTEYAIWNLNLRAEGAGARDPNSILGRLWPHDTYHQWVTMPNALGQPQVYGSPRYCLVLDVEPPIVPGVNVPDPPRVEEPPKEVPAPPRLHRRVI